MQKKKSERDEDQKGYDKPCMCPACRIRRRKAGDPAWKVYEEVTALAWNAFNEVVTPAWKAYCEVMVPARKEYFEAEAKALKAYMEAGAKRS